jgi:hypothetical protein
METGISIYLSSGMDFNLEIIEKAKQANVKHAFTSMHIPEEDGDDYRKNATSLLKACQEAGLDLTIDVDPTTPEKLGLARMEDLLDLGVHSIRLDFGFEDRDIIELSKHFRLVWNASTVSYEDVRRWESLGVDISSFKGCHNYYPKPYTGLSLEQVREINTRLKAAGFTTEAFVPGNKVLRGPLKEGLPTVENHRNCKNFLLNMLELYDAKCDIVYIGDCDIADEDWIRLRDLSAGFIKLTSPDLKLDYFKSIIMHDRPDSSAYVIRAVESRLWDRVEHIHPENTVDMEVGSICISNERYLRYEGELEICREPRNNDGRVNVVGHIDGSDLKYLPFIKNGMGFMIS